jgi:hypothetical protein
MPRTIQPGDYVEVEILDSAAIHRIGAAGPEDRDDEHIPTCIDPQRGELQSGKGLRAGNVIDDAIKPGKGLPDGVRPNLRGRR